MLKIIDEFGFSPKKFYTTEEYKSVNENYKTNDKAPVLGIVEGKSFVLDGVSRNGRFYPKQLWENVLKDTEVIQMLNDKLMFGCIGHPENYTLDELLAEGKVSHIVTDIRMGNDGYGYATYEVLDTPAGRILNTILRAGSKMKVSTRAFGEFVNEYKVIEGKRYQVINPKNFKLESIDFVIKPGIADVDVKLIEKLETENKQDLEKLKESSIQLCEDGVCTIIEEVELHKKIEEDFKKEIEKYKSIINTLKEENKQLQDEIENKNNLEKRKEELEKILIAEIENYLKEISILKNKSNLTEILIEFLEEKNPKILENIKDKLSDDIKKTIEELLNIYSDIKKDLEDYIQNEKIKNETSKIENDYKNLINEYKETIKDLTFEIVKLKKELSSKKKF